MGKRSMYSSPWHKLHGAKERELAAREVLAGPNPAPSYQAHQRLAGGIGGGGELLALEEVEGSLLTAASVTAATSPTPTATPATALSRDIVPWRTGMPRSLEERWRALSCPLPDGFYAHAAAPWELGADPPVADPRRVKRRRRSVMGDDGPVASPWPKQGGKDPGRQALARRLTAVAAWASKPRPWPVLSRGPQWPEKAPRPHEPFGCRPEHVKWAMRVSAASSRSRQGGKQVAGA